MHMDDIKQFAKAEKESEALIQAVRIYSYDLGMEFGIKIRLATIEKQKRHMTEGIEQPDQEEIRTLEEQETYPLKDYRDRS